MTECWISCSSRLILGVRFNADKKKIGMYLSTPIYSFKMNCPSCSNEIELQTDPKNADYVVTAGGSRKTETWDEEENGTLVLKGNPPFFTLSFSLFCYLLFLFGGLVLMHFLAT